MSLYFEFLKQPKFQIDKKIIHWVLFFLILGLGIFARTWEFRTLPPGLHQDEAENGVEAFNLLRYGTDRSGLSYPIKFVSWGGGQDALYGYILIPFVALLGLRPAVIRLPLLITGILSLPLLFFVSKKMFNEQFALLSMFFLSISPWHILMSRWGLEASLFPFVFLAGYACLLNYEKGIGWFVSAFILFGLCLYAYATAYAMVPVFIIFAGVILIQNKHLRYKDLCIGLFAFVVIAAPIALLVLVNLFKTNSIKIGLITIPRFPVEARFETETVLSAANKGQAISKNLYTAFKLLSQQSDGHPYNVVDPYGYFYTITFPFTLLGIFLLIFGSKKNESVNNRLLLAWIGASFVIAAFQPVDINRFNIIFIPSILCVAISLQWASTHWKPVLTISVCAFIVGFIFFTLAYHGKTYRQAAGLAFHNGIFPALRFAEQTKSGPICIDDINMPYIFVLFSNPSYLANYLTDIKYDNSQAPMKAVVSFGRYTFGRQNCIKHPAPIYILIAGSKPPQFFGRYNAAFFNNYVVYYATP